MKKKTSTPQAKRAQHEQAPAWATALVDSVNDLGKRISKLEAAPVQPAAGNGVGLASGPSSHPSGLSTWQRCAECGDKFEGPRPVFGTPALCPICVQPNHKLVQCASCNKAFSIPPGKSAGIPADEIICKTCEACFLCGTKESEQVCARCIKKGARVCDACLRLSIPGSSFCAKCDKEFRGKAADKFEEPSMPVNTREDYGNVLTVPGPGQPPPPALAANPPAVPVA